MSKDRTCQYCNHYKDEYCNVLDMKPCYPENGCDYFSRQNKLKKDTMQILEAYMNPNGIGFPDVKNAIKDLIEWSKNEYKRGWHDALSKALEESHDIFCDGECFQVIQAETLMGLGYAIDKYVAESEESDADSD